MVAAVAAASACALSVQPVMPSLQAASVSEEAVQLSAFQNPLAVWQQTIENTFGNISDRGEDISSEGLPALLASLSSPTLRDEFIGAIGNMFTEPLSIVGGFADHALPWTDALVGGPLRVPGAIWDELMLLPPKLEEAADFLADGEIFKAYHTLNVWSVYALRGITPLLPIFNIPGDVAGIFGAEKIAAVFDDLLTGRAAGGYANSLYSPVVAAMFAITETMDSVLDAVQAGEFETAASDVVNAPARVLNAFLNGITPREYPEDYVAGVFTKAGDGYAGGPIDSFFVQIPKRIAAILAPEEAEAQSTLREDAAPQVASADIIATGTLVSLNVSEAGVNKPGDATKSSIAEKASAAEETPAEEPAASADGAETGGLITDDESGEDSTGGTEEATGTGSAAGPQTGSSKAGAKAPRAGVTKNTATKRTAASESSSSADSDRGDAGGDE
ncbi:hypothetical protein [Mycolicibacterium thermoresistibile]